MRLYPLVWRFLLTLTAVAPALLPTGLVGASEPALVTEAEMRLYNPVIGPMASQPTQSSPDGPEILWVLPETSHVVRSPLDIQILVIPAGAANVDWASLRVYYGALRFDITDRILAKAQREDNRLVISKIKVPSGTHRLLIQVADTQHRQTQRERVLRVTGLQP